MLRGQYENKIRMEATFTKIFETFASEIEDGQLVMNYFDLLYSICNFSFTTKKNGELYQLAMELMKNSKILELFDLDQNKTIDIYEVSPKTRLTKVFVDFDFVSDADLFSEKIFFKRAC